MKLEYKFRNVVIVGSIAIMVGLAGCSDAAQTPAATVVATSVPTNTATSAATAEPTSVVAGTASPTIAEGGRIDPNATVDRATCAKLNLNEVTEADLMATIPGFSSRMVREFMEYRPYASIQQFRREIGKYVDTAQVAEYEKYVYVPVDANASDAETLQQLPGVDATVASTLIAGRPYATSQDFVGTLAAHVDEQLVVQAGCYLVQQ